MGPKLSFEPPRLEWGEDGSLSITKEQPSGVDFANLSFPINASIFVGILLVWAPIQAGFAWRLTGALSVVLGVTIQPLVVRAAWRSYHRIKFWSWLVDAAGVEFLDAGGVGRRLAWSEVCRVYWGSEGGFRLAGPDVELWLRPDGIADADWMKVRDRVEAALSPRFDLARRSHPAEFRLGRMALITLSLAAGSVGLVRALPHLTILQLNVITAAMSAVFLTGLIGVFARVARENSRINPPWRDPRPNRVEGNDRT